MIHPFVVGEVMLGSLRNRASVLGLFGGLRSAVRADPLEVLDLVEHHKLFGTGIGYVDAHLLASTRLTRGLTLWTRDRKLAAAAAALGLAHSLPH